MNIEYFCITDRGPTRETNEDSLLLYDKLVSSESHFSMETARQIEVSDEVVWFAIADGMGGHEAGEIASQFTLEKLKDLLQNNGPAIIENPDSFTLEIEGIHKEVNLLGKEKKKEGMGTTLTGAFFNQSRFSLFNVGDSRVYLHRKGFLEQKTRDHSLKEQSGIDFAKNIIISSIGGGEDILIDLYDLSGKIQAGDLMLICSDGLFDFDLMALYDSVETIVESNKDNLPALCQKLYQFAVDQGSKDNISLIAIKFA